MALAQEKQDAPTLIKSLPTAVAPPQASNENGADGDQNPIFDALVKSEGEVSGLVAYSIYKQNKRAWLNDFIKATGRPPSDAESRSYIIGESTERRLAIYRHLAQATLSGEGPTTPGSRTAPRAAFEMTPLLWGAAIVAMLVIIALAVHSGAVTLAK